MKNEIESTNGNCCSDNDNGSGRGSSQIKKNNFKTLDNRKKVSIAHIKCEDLL